MSSGSNQFDEANIVRDEYEIQQYGFTVDEFTKENSRFVKERIKKAMRSLDRKLEHLMKDVKPDIATKLSKTIELTASKIYKNSREDIRKINTTIETHFRIPDNVLLYGDKMYMTPPTKEDVEALEEECKQLEKAMNENAFFVHALNDEVQMYEELGEVFDTERCVSNAVDELLNNNIEADLLKIATRNIQSFPDSSFS